VRIGGFGNVASSYRYASRVTIPSRASMASRVNSLYDIAIGSLVVVCDPENLLMVERFTGLKEASYIRNIPHAAETDTSFPTV